MATFEGSASQVRTAQVTVTVPAITDPDTDSSAETVTGAKLGDIVIAAPTTAFVDTNARYLGAYASDDDEVTFVFSSVGGSVSTEEVVFNVQFYEKS